MCKHLSIVEVFARYKTFLDFIGRVRLSEGHVRLCRTRTLEYDLKNCDVVWGKFVKKHKSGISTDSWAQFHKNYTMLTMGNND